jgi:hypothetical protein
VYLGLGDGPWTGPKVRPSALPLGADWNIEKVRWADWTQGHADGRGYLVSCASAGGPCQRYWTRIHAVRVQRHRGHRYFDVMELTHGHGRVSFLVMDREGAWTQQHTHQDTP